MNSLVKLKLVASLIALSFLIAAPLAAQEEKTADPPVEEKTESSEGTATAEPDKTGDPKQETKDGDQNPEKSEQDDPEKSDSADATPVDNSFEGLLARYAGISEKLDEIQVQHENAAEETEKATLRDEYKKLVAEAKLLIDEISAAGLAKLKAGEKDQKVYETLTGIVINSVAFDKEPVAFELGQQLIDNGIEGRYFDKAAESTRLNPSGKEILRELSIRTAEASADDLPRVKLTTSKGEVVLELFENEAPATVGNFVSLVKDGFYDGLTFHRVLDDFMAQGGCPQGNGLGGPGYKIKCECYVPNYRRHFTGSLSMAKAPQRNTGGSQFFMTFGRTANLDGKHTVFGRVIEGMDIVNALQKIDPDGPSTATPDTIEKAEVIRDRGHEYAPDKAGG